MKKYILSFIILLLAGVNIAWGQNYVAKIGGVNYATLQAALNAAVTASMADNGGEITVNLLTDVADGTGLALFNTAKGDYPEANGANVKIDFGGHTYKVAGPAVGSTTRRIRYCTLRRAIQSHSPTVLLT
jgi:hypothetical protein